MLSKSSVYLALALSLGTLQHGVADTIHWQGQPGVTATTNWSDAANWDSPKGTYFNQVQFTGNGTNANGDLSINTVLDSATAASQMPIWQLDFNNTGGNYVTLINPGVTLHVDANNGWMTVGAPGTPADAAEIIKFTGEGGAMSLEGGSLTVGQSAAAPDNHNVTLDLSELGNFQKTGARLVVAATGNHSHGTMYLARTNVINLNQDITICWQGSSSNSLPCALYLGQTNSITTGSGNNYIVVGQTGGTNAILAFNPALVNSVPAPEANISSSANAGRGNLWVAANSGAPNAPAYGICDFSGGRVTMLEDSIQLGQAGNSAVASALGVLTFDNGSINANTVVVGNQTTTGAGAGAGVVNVGTNALQGANGTLIVNNSLTLAAVSGIPVAGSAGTLNLNGGVVNAEVITNGGGVATITMNGGVLATRTAGTAANPINALYITNSILQVKIGSASGTNIVVNSLTTGGAANRIDIVSLPSIGSYPFQVPILSYSGPIGGANYNFALGTLPPLAGGYLSNNVAKGTIDLVLTAGPRTMLWTGASSGDWDTTTANWFAGSAVTYSDGSFVSFLDGATRASVNLTAALQPGSLTVSNSNPSYTFTGSGYLSGPSGLVKTGSGKLILDHSGINDYAGATTISAGTLQVGANDSNGNLPSGGTVNNDGALVFVRNGNITVNNTISGTGSLTQAGGGSLVLSGPNTFSGAVLVTNGSTLQLGNASALGTGGGATIVADGSTLDFNGYYLTSEPIIVSGSGVGGGGALVNSGGAVYGLTKNLTLAGDTTFGIASRWDLDGSSGGVLSSGGNPYDVTFMGSGYFQWKRLSVDAGLGDINVTSGMNFGVVGSTTLGNPTNALNLAAGSQLTLYADDTGVTVNKQVVFNDGARIANGWWWNSITGPIALVNSSGSGYCEFANDSDPLTLGGELTGDGIIYKTGSGELRVNGNSPAFAGGAYILGGTLTVNSTLNNALGITLTSGRLNLNGTLTGSGVTSSAGTTVAGSGSASGAVDIGGSLLPGGSGVIGTLTVGGLTLEAGAAVTSDLGPVASGNNDLVQVNGNLTANGNMLYINLAGSSLENGRAYTLITYTGTFSGSFGGVTTVSPSSYTFVLTNVTTTSPKKIQAIVTGGQSSVLAWNNAMGTGEWDTQGSANWTNRTTHVSPDLFYAFDIAVFDDTVTNSPTPTTTVDIAGGQVIAPSAITNDSTLDYTITGDGQITGAGGLTKKGSSTLTLNVAGNFTGPVSISGGKVKTSKSVLGSVSSITITNNATLDFGGNAISGGKPVTISGAGVSGAGALYNSGGDVYGNVLNVTLAGDATFGSSARWDLASGSTVSGPYKLTIRRADSGGYGEWDTVSVSTNLGDIELSVGKLGFKNMGSSFGNPASALIVDGGCEVDFYSGGCNRAMYIRSNAQMKVVWNGSATFAGSLVLDEGANLGSYWGGAAAFNGSVTLNGVANIYIGDADCAFSNVLSGPGGFLTYYWDHKLILQAANTYTGPTVIGNGMVVALSGSGSISHSSLIFFGGSSTTSVHLDASGRSDQTLTLASGQTLAGMGAVAGNLVVSSGATLSPGGTNVTLAVNMGSNPTGTISATSNITLSGTTVIKLNGSGSNDVVQTAGNITYGGTLSLVNISASPLAAGNSFTLFNAAGRSGSFTITPATPGAGLAWDTTQLSSGVISVVTATPSQPVISSVTISGGNLILSGTNGPLSGNYYVLSSTNVAAPLNQWTVLATNSFNGGNFGFTNSAAGDKQRFFILQVP